MSMIGVSIIGVILAGGRATRLGGGDKGLRRVGGRTILERVIATLHPQCGRLVINANGDPARLAAFGLPVVADGVADWPGPLAGVLAGLDWAAHHNPEAAFVVTAPTDTPFLPDDLVARLVRTQRISASAIVCARSGGATHPVAALWSVGLRDALRSALIDEDLRRVRVFQARHLVTYADWPIETHDPFLNANTPDELAAADALACRLDAAPR